MKYYCIFFLFFFMATFSMSFSQNQQAIEIVNVHNDSYLGVEGTHVEMSIPKDYEKSSNFLGYFHRYNNGSIVVSEFQIEVYKNFLTIDKKQMLKTGLLVKKEIFYQINNYDALYVEGEQRSKYGDYIKILLMIGDMSNTILINASIPYSASKEDIASLRNSVLSVIYNPKQKFELELLKNISIDTTNTNLKLANSLSNSLIFTGDGNIPTNAEDKKTLVIRKIELPLELTEEQKIKITEKIIYENPVKPPETPKVKKITIDGLDAYQYYYQVVVKESLQIETVFVTAIFNKLDCYTIFANCLNDDGKNLEKFIAITNSFKLKPKN